MKLRNTLMGFAAITALGVGSAAAADLIYPIDGDPKFNWKSYHDFADKHDLKGQTLSIFGPWLTADKEGWEKVLAYFEEATGAKIENSGSDSFEQQIVIDTQAGSPANIAIFPQPGLAADVASKGLLTPLGDDTKQWLLDNYSAGQSWVDLSTYKDKDGNAQLFAFPWKADLKSLVWYVPENFKEAGYKIPRDDGGPEGADRADRQGRRHAVVHRPRLGRGDRLAGDRLGRGLHAAHAAAGSL